MVNSKRQQRSKKVASSSKVPPTKGRTFTGCWACRFKKRRCDENRPICSLCAKHGDNCSYDIRLMWLEENIYKVRKHSLISSLQARKSKSKPLCQKISKSRFKQMTHFRQLSPPTSDCEDSVHEASKETTPPNDNTFTISVRRLKIYNNAVASVFGSMTNRDYTQKRIDKKLDELLNMVENDISVVNLNCSKHGPYSVFRANPAAVTSALTDQLPSPGHSMSSAEETTTAALSSPPEDSTSLIDIIQGKIFGILWFNCYGNMILNRQEYTTWFINKMRNSLTTEFIRFLGKIIDDPDINMASCLFKECIARWSCVDWQSIAITMLVIIHGYTCPNLTKLLRVWFLQQKLLRFSMYPLVNFIINNTQDLDVLYHCNGLLGNADLFEDPYQDELTSELHVLVTERLVNSWKDTILQQLCSCQDTTLSCSQLRYWQLQLKCNQQFYKDVYAMQD
ncbi:BAK_1a_G0004230.mRNA.1.CDS.1 [Saccharomyces cerevisiae]|nr:Thi2p [Saccharomyces cerevisiae YJM1418]CAD6600943.1 HLJ1_G0016510.mRNA.1.CDS.1 [Saccharomyces cerevisiae]CAI4275437.1 BAK_1a_G0004230.mRNA.1.CDS.1 [Saccharomyces cerevisiae]CAI4283261.1 CCN_G0004300.mRNA.1.CDS.1 [Saccharomyces cerevisiae]CAI4283775.1 BAI_1a_G0004290.mRNA.1.CDS.1 [Saccharomyces cerevisiae]